MSKVIIWGHKYNINTFYYVNYGYYKAFKFLGYDTYWFDNNDDVSNINFSEDDIFFTEGQVDQKIPLIKNAKYILHYCHYHIEKYDNFGCKYINLCQYREACERGIGLTEVYKDSTVEKIKDFCFWDNKNKSLQQPWATDLLPNEIDENNPIMFDQNKNCINYIGTIGHDNNIPRFKEFVYSCSVNNKSFKHYNMIGFDLDKKLIQDSYISVDIRGDEHRGNGYIPCRIWKNLSYGKFIGTNSFHIGNILKDHVVYDDNTFSLFHSTEAAYSKLSKDQIKNSMIFVKNNHTYINRIQTILGVL